jgi:hypothetical protein
MFRKSVVLMLTLFLSASSMFAQKTLNSYKYIVVQNQYEFQKSEDQYQLNSLTKFLFEKAGYTVFISNESYPDDLALNPCLALKAMLKNNSGMLTTKVVIDLVDCYNNSVYASEEGKSKIKDYQKAYHEAIRNAFISIESLGYKYDGTVQNPMNSNASKVNEVPAAKTVTPTEVTTAVVANEVVTNNSTPQVTASETQEVVKSETPKVAEAAVVVPVVVPVVSANDNAKEQPSKVYTIEGTYFIDMWGECKIVQKGEGYSVIGGDENFEFATISKTSKPTIFMVKKTGFSQSQLLELTAEGSLQIDTDNGVKIFKRVN